MSSHPQSSFGRRSDRRDFLKTTGAAAAVAAATPWVTPSHAAAPAPAETLVTQFYRSLKPQQKKLMAFPFDHPLRSKVNNNWLITKAIVDKTFDQDQQALIREIFVKLHSERYADKVLAQVEHDNRTANRKGGFGGCAVALFGEPGTGKFEFVFSGRHVTRRCDGDSVDGAAFGGPIFYGHAARGFNEKPDHPDNIYWYQALRANELFQALDGKQRKAALRSDPRPERETKTVELPGSDADIKGLPVGEMTADQQKLARQVMADVLAPFRQADVEESMKLIESGGFDKLHFSYFQNMDIGNDKVWDVWQIEGPHMVWYFRGKPHVHTWVHIRQA